MNTPEFWALRNGVREISPGTPDEVISQWMAEYFEYNPDGDIRVFFGTFTWGDRPRLGRMFRRTFGVPVQGWVTGA